MRWPQVPRVIIIVFALSTPEHKLVFHLKSVAFGAKKKEEKRENENDPKKAACCHCYYLVITYYFYDHRWLSSSFGFLSGEQVKLMKKNVSPTFCPSRPHSPAHPTSTLVTPTRRGLCPFLVSFVGSALASVSALWLLGFLFHCAREMS